MLEIKTTDSRHIKNFRVKVSEMQRFGKMADYCENYSDILELIKQAYEVRVDE